MRLVPCSPSMAIMQLCDPSGSVAQASTSSNPDMAYVCKLKMSQNEQETKQMLRWAKIATNLLSGLLT